MQAVIFDIDDTLLHSMSDDDRLYRAAIREVLGNVRFRPSLNDYRHVSDSGILTEVLEDNEVADAERHFAAIRERFLDALDAHVAQHGPFREIDGARDLLARLDASPAHRVALATGCWRRSAELKLTTAGFDFGALPLATADIATARTDIMQHALAALGKVDQVIYYGDGEWDRRACAELGWEFRPVGARLGGITSFHGEFR